MRAHMDCFSNYTKYLVILISKVGVELSMAVQNDRESEEVLAEWSSSLEAVLYQPEVEEAIREVSHTFLLLTLPHNNLPPSLPHVFRCVLL